MERNLARVVAPIRAAGKRVRLASKSVRCPDLLRMVPDAIGYMTYTAAETAMHAAAGVTDLLLGYPTLQPRDAALLARVGAATVVDDPAQLDVLDAAGRAAGTRVKVVIDVDMSWRPLGAVHLGVRRSPLREVDDVVALARTIAARAGLAFHGVLGYEAQLAGLPDRGAFRAWQNPVKRAIKRGSQPAIVERRARVVAALAAAGLPPTIVNGGGTGSVDWSSTDPALTEITIGSGLLCGHLFDGYRGLDLEPAVAFALQVVRRPARGIATCLGGGWIASGAAGADRLPKPVWPPGCALLAGEGAGEVQTPIATPHEVALGDPIWFRPAKSGELAEHVTEYVLVRGDRVVGRAPTYRGLGQCFLG